MSRPLPRPTFLASLVALAFAPVVQAEGLTAQTVTAYPDELNISPQLQQIGVPAAWAKGATGKNVTVSVIDTGVNAKHIDLKSAVLSGFNTSSMFGTTRNTADLDGHGTHVAGIIAAAANNQGGVGVAPKAKILPIRVSDPQGMMSWGGVDRGLRLAADHSPIANASLGGGQGAAGAVRYAVGKGMLLVAAAGNDGEANPLWPARYAKAPWAKGRIIAVGAVDANNQLSEWSNRAGDTKNFYLVAPGVDINSTYRGRRSYVYMSGTSMASPHVAGVAALVKSYWPQLKAEEIASILFKTATDLGDPGVDEVFGWGLVNAERAMQPVGTTTVTTARGVKVASNTLKLTAPAASGSALKTMSVHVVATDDFNRGFRYGLASAIATQPAPALAASLQDVGRRNMLVERVLPDGSRYVAQMSRQADLQPASPSALAGYEPRLRAPAVMSGFAVVSRDQNGREWAVGGNGFAGYFFGSMNELADTRSTAGEFANPMFSLVARHSHLGVSLPLAGGWKLKSGLLTTAAAGSFAEQAGETTRPARASLFAASLTHAGPSGAVSLTAGQLAERESMLGAQGASALRMEGTLNTRFATLDAAHRLGLGWAGFASYTLMAAPERANTADSFISAHTGLRGDAFSLGLMRADAFKTGDRLSMSVSQPLRLRAGNLNFHLPQAQDEDGHLQFGSQSAGLAPAGRELRTELRYDTPLAKDVQLGTFLMLRKQPGHDASQPDDVAVGGRWAKMF